ncbi:MAG: uroporphyrinogen decarboxylase [Prevotella sp.]|nr:uroporphyrinogen decarboxylase [Prevotella sp.]
MRRSISSLLTNTLHGIYGDRPAVWMMRQAGRVLPRYRELSAQHGFARLMTDARLAAEVTWLPVEDLGVDAAILFSDILIVPEAMGVQVEWTAKGPSLANPLCQYDAPVRHVHIDTSLFDRSYQAIDAVLQQHGRENVPLIGFCGGPLTCLCYMLQGTGGSAGFSDAVSYIYRHRQASGLLLDALTEVTVEYVRGQAAHGIDAFQLFESFAGVVPEELYWEMFLPSVRRILNAVREQGVPAIFFPKGIGTGIRMMTHEVTDFLSVDWQTSLAYAREVVDPAVGLQGNMDPRLLYAAPEVIRRKLDSYVSYFREHPDWIFNLGHGLMKDIPFEQTKMVVDWVRQHDWR